MGKMHTRLITQKRKDKKRLKLKKTANQEVVSKAKKIDSAPALRQRAGITVLDVNEGPIPNCPHGPCLLFTDGNEKWFGCAVYRSSDLCKYKIVVSDDSKLEYKDARPINFEYGEGLLSKIRTGKLKKDAIYWCSNCSSYVTIPHRDPVKGPLKLSDISQNPSQLLAVSKTNKGLAQYFFTSDTLAVIGNVLSNFDSVLCIGCPSIFEEQCEKKKNAFLLDFDHRFSNFYSSDEFAHYSILNNYFYNGGDDSLKKFFKKSKQRLCIVVDPPFGVISNALEKSLNQLKQLFLSVKPNGQINFIVFLPVFIGKNLHKLPIVDYKVTYTNHPQFKHKNKTIVRMFSDVDQKLFRLPAEEGYRFCKACQRFVSKENNHCVSCESCTTTFGPTFKHCNECKRCVKPQYTHCSKCLKCHLPNRCIS